jgi:hypothetical protein
LISSLVSSRPANEGYSGRARTMNVDCVRAGIRAGARVSVHFEAMFTASSCSLTPLSSVRDTSVDMLSAVGP